MDNVAVVDRAKRIVGIFYVVAAIIVGLFLTKILDYAFGQAGVNNSPVLFGMTDLSGAIGYGAAIVAAILIWRMPRARQVSVDVALELGRVTWPSMRETRAATIAVIVASLIAAAILGFFDVVWGMVAGLVYGGGGKS